MAKKFRQEVSEGLPVFETQPLHIPEDMKPHVIPQLVESLKEYDDPVKAAVHKCHPDKNYVDNIVYGMAPVNPSQIILLSAILDRLDKIVELLNVK